MPRTPEKRTRTPRNGGTPANPPAGWTIKNAAGAYAGRNIRGVLGTGNGWTEIEPILARLLEPGSEGEAQSSALIIVVDKGFCPMIRKLVDKIGRSNDYIEVAADAGGIAWNPIQAPAVNTEELAETLAFQVNRLFARTNEPVLESVLAPAFRWILEAHGSFPGDWSSPSHRFTMKDMRAAFADPGVLQELVLRQEAQTYEKYQFEISIDAEDYDADQERFDSVAITVDDVETARGLDPRAAISPLALDAENVEAYMDAVDEGRRPPSKKYDYTWHRNGGTATTLVGDLEAGVMRWNLNRSGEEIGYSQTTRCRPTPNELQLTRRIGHWHVFDWQGLDEETRAAATERAVQLLDLFTRPQTAPVFCTTEPGTGKNRPARPVMLPPTETTVSGNIVALNLPHAEHGRLAHAAGALLKQAWLEAAPPGPAAHTPEPPPSFFICDDYAKTRPGETAGRRPDPFA